VCRRPSEQVALADWRRFLSQIAAGDLDIAAIGQLPSTQLAFSDHLEPRALEMERLNAPLWRRTLVEEPWKTRRPMRAVPS
jgi:hypothetical protein